MIHLTMTNTNAVRKFQTLGDMMRSFGTPLREIELVRGSANSHFVYVRGGLVGEARRMSSTAALTLTKQAA